jgi:hypothetical protein
MPAHPTQYPPSIEYYLACKRARKIFELPKQILNYYSNSGFRIISCVLFHKYQGFNMKQTTVHTGTNNNYSHQDNLARRVTSHNHNH